MKDIRQRLDMNRISARLLRSARCIQCLFLLLLFSTVVPAHAVVTLVSFTATAGDGQVLLRWETATEIDNAGFFVRRSIQEAGEYARISPFIPSQGDGLIGTVYTYLDTDVQNGVTYFYKLEAIENDQDVEFHGPVSVTPGGPPTPTETATTARTPPPTATHTVAPTSTATTARTPPPTATHTVAPTSTATPPPPPTDTAASTYTPPPATTVPTTNTPTSMATSPPSPTDTPGPTYTPPPATTVPATNTPTSVPTQIPTDTPEPTPTPTVVPPETPSPVPTPTFTHTPTPTATPLPTSTARPTGTSTSVSVPASPYTATMTNTPSSPVIAVPPILETETPTQSAEASPTTSSTAVPDSASSPSAADTDPAHPYPTDLGGEWPRPPVGVEESPPASSSGQLPQEPTSAAAAPEVLTESQGLESEQPLVAPPLQEQPSGAVAQSSRGTLPADGAALLGRGLLSLVILALAGGLFVVMRRDHGP